MESHTKMERQNLYLMRGQIFQTGKEKTCQTDINMMKMIYQNGIDMMKMIYLTMLKKNTTPLAVNAARYSAECVLCGKKFLVFKRGFE